MVTPVRIAVGGYGGFVQVSDRGSNIPPVQSEGAANFHVEPPIVHSFTYSALRQKGKSTYKRVVARLCFIVCPDIIFQKCLERHKYYTTFALSPSNREEAKFDYGCNGRFMQGYSKVPASAHSAYIGVFVFAPASRSDATPCQDSWSRESQNMTTIIHHLASRHHPLSWPPPMGGVWFS